MGLNDYLEKLQSLRPNRSSGRASPHKVCMLYAVIDLIESGAISVNQIPYNAVLKERFTEHFERLKTSGDVNNPHLPFHYLQSSGFWHLAFRDGGKSTYEQKSSPGERAIIKHVSHAYLDDALFSLLQQEPTRNLIRDALATNLDDFELRYSRWATAIGKSNKTVSNYLGALKSTLSNLAVESLIADNAITQINSYFEYEKVVAKLRTVEEFQRLNKRGKGMYSAALKSYGDFLADLTQAQQQQDIDSIILDETITDTEKAALVNTRIGQGKFRQDLVEMWDGCAITRYKNKDFLIASHIKPWSKSDNSERLDKYNGLLLLANIDKAFDRGYITFKPTGTIKISSTLDNVEVLGINQYMKIELDRKHQDYMAFHREVCFKEG